MSTFTVNTRKQGCEVYVENEQHSYFIGECYTDLSGKSVATTMKHANIVCDALNHYYFKKNRLETL